MSAASQSDSSSGRRIAGRCIGIAIVLTTIVLGERVARVYFLYPQTDDAYVRANTVGIAPHVSGPLVDLRVRDNQHVKKGDLLFTVDPRPYQAALDSAQARLDLTNLQIAALEASIRSAQAHQAQVAASAAYDRQYLKRIVPLLSDQFVTADQVVNARSKVAASDAAVEDARNVVIKAQNELGQLGDINARRKEAEAAVYDAQLDVGYCYIRAPFDAWVTNLNIATGQYANEGRQVMTLVDDRTWYVIANFRETFLPHIATGMTARVFLLSYPGIEFHGTIEGVGWALDNNTGGAAGLPEVAPTLNWVRLTQRFPVRITLDARDSRYPFRMGQTAVVTIQGFR